MRTIFAATLLAFSMVPALAVSAAAQALAGYGIVLLHGKGGQPGGNIASLATALEAEGAAVVMPKMAWAGAQGRPEKYDVSYEQALAPIKAAVDQLKARASKVLVAGQSLGANAAIGYAARHGAGLAGVIALAAGHTPERAGFRDRFASEVARAKQLVASGRGGALETFADTNQGNTFQVRATPSAYLSFFDPSGPAVIPRNAKAMLSLPLLWVIGRRDRLAQAGRGYAFDLAPKHPKSSYLEIDADHVGTPTAARREVIAWLKTL
jgi:pimeloyl-ACP methyl ester carboxylesterase